MSIAGPQVTPVRAELAQQLAAVPAGTPGHRAKAVAATRNPWIRSPLWDAFWVLSTLWVLPLVWFLGVADPDEPGSPVQTLYLVLTLCFWVGHRFSSAYLAYFTASYRPLLRTQRIRFVWVPLVLAIAVFAFLLPPDDALPWDRLTRTIYLIILDYGLITWHFASQHYGFLSLYRVRAGQARSTTSRRVDRAYALVMGGLLVVVAEIIIGMAFSQDVWLTPIIAPEVLHGIRGIVQFWGTLLVMAATTAMLCREWRLDEGSLPRGIYIAGLGCMVIAAFNAPHTIFLLLWATQHWIAAMGLATVVASGDRDPPPSRWYATWQTFNRRPWLLVILLGLASAMLLPIMEVELVLTGGDSSFADEIVPGLVSWLANSWFAPVLVALGFVTAFLHYQLDRAVFRLSDPEVRRAARGLFD